MLNKCGEHGCGCVMKTKCLVLLGKKYTKGSNLKNGDVAAL